MKKNKIDVALIARPDHSYYIYEKLLESNLKFVYITFKLCPQWLGRLFRVTRLRWAKGSCKQSFLMTLHNIGAYNYNIKWVSKINGGRIFDNFIRKKLTHMPIRLIHYWPDYCVNTIEEYKKRNDGVKTIADIYMPSCKYIINEVGGILKEYNIQGNLEIFERGVRTEERIMSKEREFFVPSTFVANTYSRFYKDKVFHVVSFGIEKWKDYRKKEIPLKINRFVYVGTISVEKGCDFLCEWFSKHPEYEIHLIGKIHHNEGFVFEKYKNERNIVFEGLIPKNEIRSFVTQFDIGLHLSRFDAYSLAVSEVISAGLPVIVSTTTGNCSDVLEYGFGKVVELNDGALDIAVKEVIEKYDTFIGRIDNYMNGSDYNYAQEIVKRYEEILGNNS